VAESLVVFVVVAQFPDLSLLTQVRDFFSNKNQNSQNIAIENNNDSLNTIT